MARARNQASDHPDDVGPGTPARVSRGIPDMIVTVLDNTTISHPTEKHPEGEAFTKGMTFSCEGPLAQELAAQGHVEITGMVPVEPS